MSMKEIMKGHEKIKKNILITGRPGVGKTIFILKISEQLKGIKPAGFYTKEIREHGLRRGFELLSFSGNKGLLSHVNIKSPYKVGKYKVDIKGFEIFLDSLALGDNAAAITIIDEIGKMECFSPAFRKLIRGILDSENLFIATISLKGNDFIAEIKRRDDVELVLLKEDNRDILQLNLLEKINAFSKRQSM